MRYVNSYTNIKMKCVCQTSQKHFCDKNCSRSTDLNSFEQPIVYLFYIGFWYVLYIQQLIFSR